MKILSIFVFTKSFPLLSIQETEETKQAADKKKTDEKSDDVEENEEDEGEESDKKGEEEDEEAEKFSEPESDENIEEVSTLTKPFIITISSIFSFSCVLSLSDVRYHHSYADFFLQRFETVLWWLPHVIFGYQPVRRFVFYLI